jgi:hypothetical protein
VIRRRVGSSVDYWRWIHGKNWNSEYNLIELTAREVERNKRFKFNWEKEWIVIWLGGTGSVHITLSTITHSCYFSHNNHLVSCESHSHIYKGKF